LLRNYANQGATGVRFQFALGGGAASTPFSGSGTVSSTWVTNLGLFFSDVASADIYNVTPTSAMIDTWSGTLTAFTVNYPSGGGCPSGGETLYYFPWLPFGLNSSESYYPDESLGNQAYACSPPNPASPDGNFWGWTPYFNLFDQILSDAQTAGINIQEFDLQNESNLQSFPVMARLIYDNMTSTGVLETLGEKMADYGFSATAVTTSVSSASPGSAGGDCGSLYGDSAHLMLTSELLAATGGALIGNPPYISWNGDMPCDASPTYCGSPGSPGWYACATAGMISLPATVALRTVTDMHTSPCVIVSGACSTTTDVTSTATNMFSDVWTYLQYRSLTSNLAMFGETWSNSSTTSCDGGTQTMAQESASGFLSSTLYSGDGSNVVIRPWEDAPSSNCTTPAVVGSPSGPYAP